MDGGRSVESTISAAIVTKNGTSWPAKRRAEFQILYDEDAQATRKQRSRGVQHLVERLHVLSEGPLNIEKKKRLNYAGSNLCSWIGPVAVPSWEDPKLWRVERSAKNTMLGSGKVAVGGAMPADMPERPQFADSREPMNWHPLAEGFCAEILHSFNIRMLVDMTCMDETWAVTCLRKNVGYVGVVFTDGHQKAISSQVVRRLFKEYQDEQSPLYQVQLAELMQSTGHGETEDANADKKTVKPKMKGKKRAADPAAVTAGTTIVDPKAKSKASKRAASAQEILNRLTGFTQGSGSGQVRDISPAEACES